MTTVQLHGPSAVLPRPTTRFPSNGRRAAPRHLASEARLRASLPASALQPSCEVCAARLASAAQVHSLSGDVRPRQTAMANAPKVFTAHTPPFVTRSMPHAESSSFPRGTRTVQITPSSMSLAWKAWTASGGDGKKRRPAAPSPAFALYGMRLMRVLPDTRGRCGVRLHGARRTRQRRQQRVELLRVLGAVVDAVDERHLRHQPAVAPRLEHLACDVGLQPGCMGLQPACQGVAASAAWGVAQLRHGVPSGRHQQLAQLVVGRVHGPREPRRQRLERAYVLGRGPHGGDAHVLLAEREAEGVRHRVQRAWGTHARGGSSLAACGHGLDACGVAGRAARRVVRRVVARRGVRRVVACGGVRRVAACGGVRRAACGGVWRRVLVCGVWWRVVACGAPATCSTLSAGSPMPMNTTLRSGGMLCSRISSDVRERSSPIVPVAQKVQPCRQPTWDDTQSVEKPRCGMMTVSTSSPRGRRSSSLRVPHSETEVASISCAGGEKCAWSAALVFCPSPLPSSNGSRPSLRTSQTSFARPEPPRGPPAAVGATPSNGGRRAGADSGARTVLGKATPNTVLAATQARATLIKTQARRLGTLGGQRTNVAQPLELSFSHKNSLHRAERAQLDTHRTLGAYAHAPHAHGHSATPRCPCPCTAPTIVEPWAHIPPEQSRVALSTWAGAAHRPLSTRCTAATPPVQASAVPKS
eukprot:scaffold27423_cov64-Phaeocystis_antarctica.AAC.7